MKRTIFTGSAMILLAACFTPRSEFAERQLFYGRTRALDTQPEIVCDNEAPTGSHIRQRVCRRQADIDQIRMATQERLSHMRSMRGSVDDLDMPVVNVKVDKVDNRAEE
jgi:hypothetical protein